MKDLVNIYSIVFNRPEFILLQYSSLLRHFKNKFQYTIVNNSLDEVVSQQINIICNMLGIPIVDIAGQIPKISPSNHHGQALNYIWKKFIINNKHILILDADIFFIKENSFQNIIKDGVIAASQHSRNRKYHYLCPTILAADIEKLPNPIEIDWTPCIVDGVALDTGGSTYHYLLNNPLIKELVTPIKCTWGISTVNNNLHCIPDSLIELYDDSYNIEFFGNEFLHYCKGTGWNAPNQAFINKKTAFTNTFVLSCMNGSLEAIDHNFQMENDYYFGWPKE